MMGTFLPTPPQFTDKSVWSILNQYLNPAVNEMYTALRTNGDGNVVPTLVVRQLPFSTEFAPTDIQVTKFLDLPRWKVAPDLVKKADVGRSDSMRINFVHVYGDAGVDRAAPFSAQIVRNPPKRDDLDIARSGLRPYMMTVNCAPQDIRLGGATKWMALLSDIVMGQHMTVTGLVEMVGVQAPICEGDNLEWDDTVFHIESVTHNCSINANGQKSFTTTVALTHGMAAEPGIGLLSLYSGVELDGQRTYEAGLTDETDDHNDEPLQPQDQAFTLLDAISKRSV